MTKSSKESTVTPILQRRGMETERVLNPALDGSADPNRASIGYNHDGSLVYPTFEKTNRTNDDICGTPSTMKEENADELYLEGFEKEVKHKDELTKKEILCALGLTCVIVMLVVSVVAAVVLLREEDNAAAVSAGSGKGVATHLTTKESKLEYVIEAIRKHGSISSVAEAMPRTIGELEQAISGLGDFEPGSGTEAGFETIKSMVLAANWFINEDTGVSETEELDRFALAAVYFATGGQHWTDNTKWLTSAGVCSWSGISCHHVEREDKTGNETSIQEFYRALHELDFKSMNLTGKIPEALGLLDEVRALWLDDNALSGTIPGDVLGDMPKLAYLYLQDNELIGTIPVSLGVSGVLSTSLVTHLLLLHLTDLTWPFSYKCCCRYTIRSGQPALWRVASGVLPYST